MKGAGFQPLSFNCFIMKWVRVCLGVLFSLFLWRRVYVSIPYQLCEWEHESLFLMDWEAFCEVWRVSGGLGAWLSGLGMQFFAIPYWGALVFVLPVVLLLPCMVLLLRKVNISDGWVFVVAAVLLLSQYDFYYQWTGCVCLFLVMALLSFFGSLKSGRIKALCFAGSIPVVFYLLGSVATVYAVCGMLMFFSSKDKVFTFLLPFVCWILTVREGYSPAFYYNSFLPMPWYHWTAWLVIVLLLAWGRFRMSCLQLSGRAGRWIIVLSLWVVGIGIFLSGQKIVRREANQMLWQLNHYAFTEQWEEILNVLSRRPLTNQVYMNYANMALAQKGMLGDYVFYFQPYGTGALLVNGNNTGAVRLVMSDVFYTVGCVAEAQQHAFEAQMTFSRGCGVQTMIRLVKTNLILGHYAVADKYLSILEKTLFYRKWAREYRHFLYNDEAVEADAVLGEKRRSLSGQNRFAMFYGWRPELEDILQANPANEKAAMYLGVSYLLAKDMEGFRCFLGKYYGTACLKELPHAFQQGVVALYQQEKERWGEFGVSPEVRKQYESYQEALLRTRNNRNRKAVLAPYFKDTYWFYLMFV